MLEVASKLNDETEWTTGTPEVVEEFWIGHSRYIDEFLHQRNAVFSLYLAGASAGTALSSLLLMLRPQVPLPDLPGWISSASRPGPGRGALDEMEKQGSWSSILHGLGWLCYGAVFFAPNLWLSLTAMVTAFLLQGPVLAVWPSLIQRELNGRYPDDMGKVVAAISFYQLLFTILGSLVIGWMMAYLPTGRVLWLIGGVMVFMAVLDFIEPYHIFPGQKPKELSQPDPRSDGSNDRLALGPWTRSVRDGLGYNGVPCLA
jgi:hypothetical protein